MKTVLNLFKNMYSKHIACMAVVLGLLTGCKSISDMAKVQPFDNVTYKIKYQPAQTLVQGLIVDAKTGIPLRVPVQILITGKDAGRIVTFEGKALTRFTTERGDLYLGLLGTVPTVKAPAEIKIVADAAGYIPSSVTVPLVQALNSPFTVRLTKESDPPAGVTVKSEPLPVSTTGYLTAEKQITVSSPASGTTAPVQATIQFPNNTLLRDEKGNPVITTVTATVSTYSTQLQTAMASTPIGFSVELAKDANGKTGTKGPLQPAGYVAVELNDANGNKVSSFSQPVLLSMSIASDFVHPVTKTTVKAGDDLQVYTYDEKTGVWAYEQMVKVEKQGTGLGVQIPVTHFSGRVVGWMDAERCAGTTVYVGGLPPLFSFLYEVRASLETWMLNGSVNGEGQAFIFIPGDVKFQKGSVEFFTLSGVSIFKYSGELCNVLPYIEVKAPDMKNTVDVACIVKATCENGKKFELTSPATIYYGKASTSAAAGFWPSTQFGTDGKGTFVGLEPNTEYEGRLYYNDVFIQPFKTGATNSTLTFEYQIKGDVSFCKQ